MTDPDAPALWLSNPLRPDRPAVAAPARGDPGRIAGLVLPASLAFELRLVQRCRRMSPGGGADALALPYTGPVELRIGDRRAYFGALIEGPSVRLGLLALEELDLTLDPLTGGLRLGGGAAVAVAGAPDAQALSAWPPWADGP